MATIRTLLYATFRHTYATVRFSRHCVSFLCLAQKVMCETPKDEERFRNNQVETTFVARFTTNPQSHHHGSSQATADANKTSHPISMNNTMCVRDRVP